MADYAAKYYGQVEKPDLIPSYNRSREKFFRLYEAIMKQADDLLRLLDMLITQFSLDGAKGNLLDVLGGIVGISRVYPYSSEYVDGILNDEEYSLLIRAKAAANVWDGTLGNLQEMLDTLFPEFQIEIRDCYVDDGGVIDDNAPGHVRLVLHTTGGVSDAVVDFLSHGMLVPVPAGVKLSYDIPRTFGADTALIRTFAFEGSDSGVQHTD